MLHQLEDAITVTCLTTPCHIRNQKLSHYQDKEDDSIFVRQSETQYIYSKHFNHFSLKPWTVNCMPIHV